MFLHLYLDYKYNTKQNIKYMIKMTLSALNFLNILKSW